MSEVVWKPRILGSGGKLKKELAFFCKNNPGLKVKDEYRNQLEELFLLRHPEFRYEKDYADQLKRFVKEHLSGEKELKNKGSWVYFSWLKTLVHVLSENLFLEMRTGRNRNLITSDEQKNFYNSTLAVAGLSVGSHALATIVMSGGPKNLRIADPDTLSGSNLNRIRTGVQNIGEQKVILAARQIYEMNPYSKVEIFEDGVNEKNVDRFLHGVNLLIEEMDNPYYKFIIREVARRKRLPVIMATDNGDNIFVDIERFDLEGAAPLFNGLVEDLQAKDVKNLNPRDLPRIAAKIAGAEIATTRMQQSVLEVGKSLYSWPQLGTAANLCGSALTFLARNIINGYNNYKSGRYEINLDSIFDSNYKEKADERAKNTKIFLKTIGI